MMRADYESVTEFLLRRLPVSGVRNLADGLWELSCVAVLGAEGDLKIPFTVTCSELSGEAVFRHDLDFRATAENAAEVERLLSQLQPEFTGGIHTAFKSDTGLLQLIGKLQVNPPGVETTLPATIMHALVEALVLAGPVLHAVAVEGVSSREVLEGCAAA